ncbi:MAG: ribulose-phosphate 3-epimerase [Rikenellaceae bacterium]
MRIVSPSVLAADFGNLGRDIEMLNQSAAEWIHVDVMDGVFVPNISFGFPVLSAVRKLTTKVLDVHLMIVEPQRYFVRFIKSGADMVTFHYEATGGESEAMECIEIIKNAGAKAGISIKPATDVETLRYLLPHLDLVLVMSVEPGFGGQKFLESSIDKVAELRKMIEECGSNCMIEVDGGISSSNAELLFEAGADAVVAGNAVFKATDPHAEIEKIIK